MRSSAPTKSAWARALPATAELTKVVTNACNLLMARCWSFAGMLTDDVSLVERGAQFLAALAMWREQKQADEKLFAHRGNRYRPSPPGGIDHIAVSDKFDCMTRAYLLGV